jgi:hypothetical protein
MSRSVEDIDFYLTPAYRTVFGRNGDPAFSFQIHAVHQTLFDLLVFPKKSRLTEHLIYEGGFSMVYMGNDGNVADGRIDAQGILY